MNNRRTIRITLAAVISLLIVPLLALAALLYFDWNLAKPWLNARTSEALGRAFEIRGDLTLTWQKPTSAPNQANADWHRIIKWPYLIAQDIHIADPSDMGAEMVTPATLHTSGMASIAGVSKEGEIANIRQLTFSLNPFALIDKKIVIPVLSLQSPVIRLLRNADGKNNWTFKNTDTPSAWQLELQSVIFTKGSIHLLDAVKHADVTADVDTIDTDPGYGVAWQLQGKFNGEQVSGNGKAGAVLSLQKQTTPYPIVADLRVGQTVISIDGSLTRPSDLSALDMRLALSGISMGQLYALSGIYLPETPPFSTEGHLIGTFKSHGGHWVYDQFRGMVGSSDINGSIDFQQKKPRSLLSGTVVSTSLNFSDLAPLIGADSNASKVRRGTPTVQPVNKIFPVEPFKTDRWNSIDADIQFSAENIIRKEALPIKKLTTKLRLQDGVLSLLPLNFELAGGSLSSNIRLDGNTSVGKNAIKAEIKMTARHLGLKQLFPALQPLQASFGEINGDASLSAVGNSFASLLGASNGEIKALINQGTISKLLLEEMGLNIGSVVMTNLVGDKQIKINCIAADFDVNHGLMQTNNFVVDTDAAILNVSGNINLAQEQFDLTIKPNSTGLRVFSLRAPLYLRGDFMHPQVSINKGIMAMRAGGAIALAALAPVAALLPLISTGPQQSDECARLLADARVKPVAPPPGQTVSPSKTPRSGKMRHAQ